MLTSKFEYLVRERVGFGGIEVPWKVPNFPV
jgi:hypothetical protein